MSRASWQTGLLVLVLLVFLPRAAKAQEQKTTSPQGTHSKSAEALKPAAQLPLRSVTLVSTEEAVRNAAEEARAKAQTSKTLPEKAKQAEADTAAGGAVLEFHPTDSLPGKDPDKGGFQQKGRSKSVLKNIHGSAYGATASTGRVNGEGGEVGADSWGGKVNIYVEGEHAHSSTPVPH